MNACHWHAMPNMQVAGAGAGGWSLFKPPLFSSPQQDPKTGLLATWSIALLWPYHLALRVKLGVQRARRHEDLWNQVAPGWFLGGWPASAAALPASVGAVVDVTAELPRTHALPYHCAPVWDTHAPTVASLDPALAWASAQRSAGRSVYVHCAHGHGRSAAVLVAALLDSGAAADADAALALVQAARPLARLNHRQRAAVDNWWALRRKRG